MKNLIVLALAFMLSISAAAATGNNNCIEVDIYNEAADNCITGDVFMAQMTDIESYLSGSNNEVYQYAEFYADDNSLAGNGDDLTSLTQVGEMTANATGSNNEEWQWIGLAAMNNCLTIGNISQDACQEAEVIGCDNIIDQENAALAGIEVSYDAPSFEAAIEQGIPTGNSITMGDLMQKTSLDACVVGSENEVLQWNIQEANENCLTDAILSQYAEKEALIAGSWNLVEQGVNFDEQTQEYDVANGEIAYYNSLTGAIMIQNINELAEIIGSDNYVNQQAWVDSFDNCLINAIQVQGIEEAALIMGCENNVFHQVYFDSIDNSLTGGLLTQMAEVQSHL
jgi:hypothetical protein